MVQISSDRPQIEVHSGEKIYEQITCYFLKDGIYQRKPDTEKA